MPYWFSSTSVKFPSHTGKKRQFWPILSVSGLELQFEFTNGFEMIHKPWGSIEEVPYRLSRSSRSHGLKNRRSEFNVSEITRPVAGIKSLRFALLRKATKLPSVWHPLRNSVDDGSRHVMNVMQNITFYIIKHCRNICCRFAFQRCIGRECSLSVLKLSHLYINICRSFTPWFFLGWFSSISVLQRKTIWPLVALFEKGYLYISKP